MMYPLVQGWEQYSNSPNFRLTTVPYHHISTVSSLRRNRKWGLRTIDQSQSRRHGYSQRLPSGRTRLHPAKRKRGVWPDCPTVPNHDRRLFLEYLPCCLDLVFSISHVPSSITSQTLTKSTSRKENKETYLGTLGSKTSKRSLGGSVTSFSGRFRPSAPSIELCRRLCWRGQSSIAWKKGAIRSGQGGAWWVFWNHVFFKFSFFSLGLL